MTTRWALLWRSRNSLDGLREHIIYENCLPALFLSRQKARDWRDERYGYIRKRPDLRAKPYGWRLPLPVRVNIVLAKQTPEVET